MIYSLFSSTFVLLVQATRLKHDNTGELVKEELDDGWDDQLLCHIIYERLVCHRTVCVFDLVVVFQTKTTVLYDRLANGRCMHRKLHNNIECGIFEVLLEEEGKSCKEEIVPSPTATKEDMSNNTHWGGRDGLYRGGLASRREFEENWSGVNMFAHGRKTQRLSSDIVQRVIQCVRQTSQSFSSTLASEHQRLAGQVAVITGGVSGIGAATARLFTRHGARVVVADIQPLLGEKLLKELGPQARYVECDLRKEEDIQRLVETAYALENRLDIYHSNAGIIGSVGPIDEIRIDEYDATIAVNLRAAVIGIKHAVRFMRPQRRGSIVISGSVASLMGGMGPHGYTIAKAGLLGLVKSCAAELGPFNIRVNMTSPGRVATPFTAFALSALAGTDSGSVTVEDIDKVVRKPTLLPDKVLTDFDVANAALFLASDMGGYISGHNLVLDGGRTAAHVLGAGGNTWYTKYIPFIGENGKRGL
ncbi:hypothetical protein R1sor_009407 [Riccia sorocarpa]|uniref:Uncharacterized protein n=1 Tax=Riccia sorocarpa TaxID=122646 RepID=A0ABD3HWW2_9MARC